MVDKNGTGLTQLWRQMLSQFPLCALETSEAIASVYGSPIALLEVSIKNVLCCLHNYIKADFFFCFNVFNIHYLWYL